MATDPINKLHLDYRVSFGDGVKANLDYPVYSVQSLSVPDEVTNRLVRQLRAVDAIRQDVQPNGIVHDIIDPSLHGNILGEKEKSEITGRWEERNAQLAKRGIDFRDGDDASIDPYDIPDHVGGEKEHDLVKDKRGAFQWVPAIVRFHQMDGNWVANFESPIAGVPHRSFASQFYKDIEAVLSAMMPLFAELRVTTTGTEHELQIVTKVQEYVLPPKSKYSGRWHTEGFSERIVAAGVFYLDVSPNTTGGNLLFRPPDTPAAGCDGHGEYTRRGGEEDDMGEDDPFAGEFTTDDDILEEDVYEANQTELADEFRSVLKEIFFEEAFQSHRHDDDCVAANLQSAKTIKDLINTLREQGPGTLGIAEVIGLLVTLTEDQGKKEIRQNEHLKTVRAFRRYTKSVPVGTGTAVVFQNTIPHRFNTIDNNTDRVQRRLFINFFLVDPSDPLTCTTANSAAPTDVSMILRQNGVEETGIHSGIMEYCGGYTIGNFVHRKIVRDQARAAMSMGRQHWKTQYFGNAGLLKFYPDARHPRRFAIPMGRGYGLEERNYEHSATSSALGSGL